MDKIEHKAFRLYALYLESFTEQGYTLDGNKYVFSDIEFDGNILGLTKDEVKEARKWLVEKEFIKTQGQRVQLLAVDGLYIRTTDVFYQKNDWMVHKGHSYNTGMSTVRAL